MDAKLNREASVLRDLGVLSEWLLLVSALALFTITETYQPYVTVGLALLAVFYAERGLRGKLIAVRTGLEIPLLLFVLSAGLSTWLSYNQGPALLQFARLLAAVGVFLILVESRPPVPEAAAFVFLTAAAGLALYWPLKNDFSISPGKLAWITATGLRINALLPSPPGPAIHNNVAAGVLLVSIPFGAALIWQFWRERRQALSALAGLLSGVVLFGLLMTSSRGAWIGLASMAAVAGLAAIQRRWFVERNARRGFWIVVGVLALLAFGGLLTSVNLDRLLGALPAPDGAANEPPVSRLSLWREGMGIIQDYPFTGSGLQSYWMVHAVYGLLINVPFIAHAHNSFLQVWIEQGLPGALALIWMTAIVAGWAWRGFNRLDVPLLGWAGLAALFAAAVHGIVDVVFYVERTLPVLGFLLGFAALSGGQQASKRFPKLRSSQIAGVGAAFLLLILFAGLLLWRPLAAAWHANLGALHQTRLELSRYDPQNFDNPTLDKIRMSTDLSAAQAEFNQALAYQPGSPAAVHRLAMISLSRGEYDQALLGMESAWHDGKRDRTSRLLYGDALVAAGNPRQAAEIVAGLSWAKSRLLFQAWYRYWLNQDYRRAADAWKAVIWLDPTDQEAAKWLIAAQKKLNP